MFYKTNKGSAYPVESVFATVYDYLFTKFTLWIKDPVVSFFAPESLQASITGSNLASLIIVRPILYLFALDHASRREAELNDQASISEPLTPEQQNELEYLNEYPYRVLASAVAEGAAIAIAYNHASDQVKNAPTESLILMSCVASRFGQVAYDACKFASKKWSEWRTEDSYESDIPRAASDAPAERPGM